MERNTKKFLRRWATFGIVAALLVYFLPWFALVLFAFGLIDVMRNNGKTRLMFERYFAGNGIFTWLLSPLNLLADLLCKRNPGVLTLDDFPPEYRAEITKVLEAFDTRKDDIIADIDTVFPEGRRGMYVFRWFGRRDVRNIEELDGDFKYIKTIAVSVFAGGESTKWHYGPLRLSYRILYNLTPIDSDKVFIECHGKRHYWRDDPLYIFDDTLFHRSVNELTSRRYCVFMDIARPSAFPALIDTALSVMAAISNRIKGLFYKNWRMLGAAK